VDSLSARHENQAMAVSIGQIPGSRPWSSLAGGRRILVPSLNGQAMEKLILAGEIKG
jgi:hypothetical protein